MVSELIKDTDFQDNEEVYKRLSNEIIERFVIKSNNHSSLRRGPLEINNFSICFGIDILGDSGLRGLYVKIPKADLFLKKEKEIMPLTEIDRKFAEAEYQSLSYLSQYWCSDDISIRFAKPLDFLKDYNAIVIERIYAKDAFKFFRKCDLLGRLHINSQNNPIHIFLFRLGMALSRFHKTSLKHTFFKIEGILRKIEYYCTELKSFGVNSGSLNNIIKKIRDIKDYERSTHLTKTLKGLDIRNILIDKNGNLLMIDPGKIKEDVREGDLARFLVTCRILYWGSILFFLGVYPHPSYEESFLNGYYGDREREEKIITILIIKELLKHWCMAHTVLQLRPCSGLLKNLLKRFYINPFYKSQITKEMAKIVQ